MEREEAYAAVVGILARLLSLFDLLRAGTLALGDRVLVVARVLVDEALVSVLLTYVVVVKVACQLARIDGVLIRVRAVVRRLNVDVLGADAVAAGKVVEAVEVGIELVDGARVNAAVGLRERLSRVKVQAIAQCVRAEAGLAG